MLWVGINETTVALVDLHELLNERLDRRLWRSTAVGDDAYSPGADVSLVVGHRKLATTEVQSADCICKTEMKKLTQDASDLRPCLGA